MTLDQTVAAALSSLDPTVFGPRLRQMRRARSLRQTDLAGHEVSVGYVSRIEAGLRRPDAKLVEVFAQRLGVSIAELLSVDALAESDDEARLLEARVRWLLSVGSVSEAVDLAHELDTLTDTHGASRAGLLLAQTMQAVGDLQGAIARLTGVVDASVGHLNIEASIALNRCYREAGELPRAISAGEAALARVRECGLDDSDAAIQLMVTVAAAYFEHGDVNHAVRMCGDACTRAEATGSPLARASAYWNASIFESQRGDTQSAVSLAENALFLMRQQADALNVARLQGQLGIMQLRLDPPKVDDAMNSLGIARRALRANGGSAIDIANVEVAIARAHFLRGDNEGAADVVVEALERMGDQAPIAQTDARILLGEMALGRSDTDGARAYFENAAAALTAAGADRAAAQLWFDVAARLQAVGNDAMALEAYRNASVAAGLLPTALTRTSVAN